MYGDCPLPSARAWFQSLRAYSFTASLMPAALAAAAARTITNDLTWWTFPLYVLAAVLFHAGTNVLNDYYDHIHGVDPPDDPDPTHAISRGVVTPGFMRMTGNLYFLVGVLTGSIIGFERGWLFVAAGLVGAVGSYFYTGARFSFKYVALGDVLVFLLMGPALVVMGVWALAGVVTMDVAVISLPIAFLVTAILHGNNLRDRDGDRAAGVKTLANRLSATNARRFFAALVALPYLLLVPLSVTGIVPLWSLLVLLSAPVAVPLVARVLRSRGSLELMRLPLECARLHLLFSLLYVAAVSIS